MLGQELARLSRLLQYLAEVNRLAMELRPTLVGARQREQRIQELRHPIHFLERLFQCRERLRRGVRARDRTLHAGAHDRQWRLELMARIRGEAS